MDMISSRQFYTGSLRSVHFLVCDGNCEMDEFLDSLRSQKPVEFDKLCRLLQFHCDSDIRNEEKLKTLQDGLYELKSHQIRVIFFYHCTSRNVVVCTHGILKKKDKLPPAELARALRFKREFEEAHKGGKK
jgi:phage-related protein